ncbi:MAG: pyridoxamine 5'-phosphate oxidase family protein, partial [Actinobacteria bacterium]|nr:pyridoxamine 5'-phosphate oxidase family protein [Actinomycetota bacterium]
MAGGSCTRLDELPDKARRIMVESRRAVLATVDGRARPHVVPVCWAEKNGSIATPVDDKPKRGDKLQRVLNVERNLNATVLFDRYE